MGAKRFLLGVLSGVLLAAVGVAVVLALVATHPPSWPVPPTSPVSGDIIITVGEGYVSRLATEMVQSEEESIEDLTVDLHPEGRMDMFITARVNILGAAVGLRLKMLSTMAVEEQRLRFSLHNIGFVGLAVPLELLPASLRGMLEGMETDWNLRINNALVTYGFVPVSLATDESSITIGLRAQ